jgi:3-oxoacyl-[acyl-carrier-protein] synthase-3
MRILGTGGAAPSKVLTNAMLSQMVETDDEWIRTRTGICSRRIAVDETTLSLASQAAAKALASSGLEPGQIDIVICATLSNDLRCPSVACGLQRELGCREDILAFDLNAACSGFVYALICASKLLSEGKHALVVGSEVLSRLVDFTDRSTCVLFGDGAAAVVAAPDAPGRERLFTWVSEARGGDRAIRIDDKIHMDGPAVFKFAVEALSKSICGVVASAGLGLADVGLFVCHQANERIIASAAARLGLPLERFFMNLSRFGNTSAASIPLALDEACRQGLLSDGDHLVMAGFGGGLTAGAVCMEWS